MPRESRGHPIIRGGSWLTMETTYLGADEMALDLRMDIPEGATFMAIGLMARPHCSAESRITAAKTLRCILLCPSSDRGARGEASDAS
jgi:hypothetical protein